MEGVGNPRRCSPYLRALVLITIAVASFQYADADCPVANVPTTDANAVPTTTGITSWTPGQTVTYTCTANTHQVVTGSGVANTYVRTCTGTTFSTPSPSGCVAIACRSAPPVLGNAVVGNGASDQALNMIATYTCNAGTTVVGGGTTITYTCQLKSGSTFDAEWAYTAGQTAGLVCAAPVCPSTAPTEANAVAGTVSSTAGGSTITYTCITDFQVVSGTTASSTFTRTCTNGAWATASPAGCTAVRCLSVPPTDTNAQAVPANTPSAVTNTYTYTCNANYVVSIGKNTYIKTCTKKSSFEAEWKLNANEPAGAKCIAFGCPNPATLTNAVAGAITLPSTGGEVTFTCNAGYQAVTGTTAAQTVKGTCVGTGTTWTLAPTTGCTEIKCQTQPPTENNAQFPAVSPIPADVGKMVTYTCTTNFVVSLNKANYVKICAKKSDYEAEWKLQTGEPIGAMCVAVMCSTASVPATDVNATPGTPTGTTVGATVTYTCKSGFQVVSGTTATGTYTRSCTSTGWANPTPNTCTAIKCLDVPPTDTGAPAPPSTTAPAALNTVYTYTCKTNYVVAITPTIDSSYARKCQQKTGSKFLGEWALNSGEPTTAACVLYNCATASAPTDRSNAKKGAISLANGGQVTYTCNTNFQSTTTTNGVTTGVASFTIKCTNNAWPTTPTGCTATKCQSQPTADTNGATTSVSLPAVVNTEAKTTCNTGAIVAVGDTDYIRVCQIKTSATYQGEWALKSTEPAGATCSAFSCPTTAPARDNAVAGTIVTSGGGSITYTCKSGYEYKVGSTITSTFTIKCTTTNTWPSSPTGCTKRTLRGWEIALIVVGVLLAVGGIILVSCLCWWYNKNKAADPSDMRQLQVDRQDYTYGQGMGGYGGPGMGGYGGPPPSAVPPYSRGNPNMAPFQPYSGRSIDASRYNRGKFDSNYMYGTKPEMPF